MAYGNCKHIVMNSNLDYVDEFLETINKYKTILSLLFNYHTDSYFQVHRNFSIDSQMNQKPLSYALETSCVLKLNLVRVVDVYMHPSFKRMMF